MGIPVKKMILGVPWYGYRYPCQEFVNGVCYIKEVPFRLVYKNVTVAQHVAHSLVVGEVIGSNLGPTPRYN